MLKLNNFQEFLFEGFELDVQSNKYIKSTTRINDKRDKLILFARDNVVFETRFGYGLNISADQIVWLKDWQVFKSSQAVDLGDSKTRWLVGYEIVIDKKYFKPVPAKSNPDYENETLFFDDVDFDYLLNYIENEEEVKEAKLCSKSFKITKAIEPEKLEVKDEEIINELTINSIK